MTASSVQVSPSDFAQKVYRCCSEIPKGKYQVKLEGCIYIGCFSTYGDVAKYLKTSPRAVGQALKRNPNAPTIPCHRVISSSYKVGGFFGDWKVESANVQRKIALLQSEGLDIDADGKIEKSLRSLRHTRFTSL